ncbi:MAG: HDOD domain-containing protein [Desulfobacteraceae bacterium]|nr:MAG: HDOD domain-containing protein [Desulfobacteraceae bacterium]
MPAGKPDPVTLSGTGRKRLNRVPVPTMRAGLGLRKGGEIDGWMRRTTQIRMQSESGESIMIFQGDLSKYHPADALMFLSQLSLNGVLSVAHDQQILTLSFNAGHLLDAQSAAGDEKILQALLFHKVVTRAQEAQIRQIRSETGMPVRQVLGELDLFPLAHIKKGLEIGISEVMLELFLLETGQFHFTDTPVESDSAGIKLDTGAVAIKVLSHADEFRSLEKSMISLERKIELNAPADQLASLSLEERTLARLAAEAPTVRQLIARAPFYSHKALQIAEKLIAAENFRLMPLPEGHSAATPASAPLIDPLFGAYKQAFKMLIRTAEVVKKVEAVIGFCKNFYDGILILTARGQQIVHCKAITIERGRSIRQRSFKGNIGAIDQDPVFQTVHKTGIGFFGKTFPSSIIDRVAQTPPAGECALLPILNQPQITMFFYVFTGAQYGGLSPHHYLELLSWLITPADKVFSPAEPIETHAAQHDSAAAPQGAIAQLVARIEELPPLPSTASRSLQLLSDPETPMESVEKTIAQDQALVAKIIKVSNSALYGGFQKVNSLRHALTRLGAKTTKSLILAASARSYFFKERKGMKVWGPLLWQHSVECGLAARRIAAACRYEDPEQAFIGGIMHDIGKLAILMLDDKRYQEIQRLKATEKKSDLAAETEILGSSHTELGRLLMEKWRMPEAIQACTEFHHNPGEAGRHADLSAIVAYANHLSHLMGSHPQPELQEDQLLVQDLMRTTYMSSEQNALLLEALRADFQNTEMMD